MLPQNLGRSSSFFLSYKIRYPNTKIKNTVPYYYYYTKICFFTTQWSLEFLRLHTLEVKTTHLRHKYFRLTVHFSAIFQSQSLASNLPLLFQIFIHFHQCFFIKKTQQMVLLVMFPSQATLGLFFFFLHWTLENTYFCLCGFPNTLFILFSALIETRKSASVVDEEYKLLIPKRSRFLARIILSLQFWETCKNY